MIFIFKVKSVQSFLFTNIKNSQLLSSKKYCEKDSTIYFHYDDDDDDDNLNKRINNILIKKINYEYEYNLDNILSKPLYTLVWYDCDKCKKLLNDMELIGLKKIYLNINNDLNELNDFTYLNNNLQKPLLFKDEYFVSDNLFEIYEEIYKN